MNMKVLCFISALLTVQILTGCTRSGQSATKWTGTYQEKANDITLDFTGVKLIFKDIVSDNPQNGSKIMDGGNFAMPRVGGNGGGMSSITVREGKKRLVFTESYNNGINEMTFADHKFRVQDNGKSLIIGSQKFDLSSGKKTIIVDKNGTAHPI